MYSFTCVSLKVYEKLTKENVNIVLTSSQTDADGNGNGNGNVSAHSDLGLRRQRHSIRSSFHLYKGALKMWKVIFRMSTSVKFKTLANRI